MAHEVYTLSFAQVTLQKYLAGQLKVIIENKILTDRYLERWCKYCIFFSIIQTFTEYLYVRKAKIWSIF